MGSDAIRVRLRGCPRFPLVPDPDRAYTVTVCAKCGLDSALVVLPPKYVCAACAGTGTVEPGGNVPDAKADGEVQDEFRVLLEERESMIEFRKLARKALRARPRLVEG